MRLHIRNTMALALLLLLTACAPAFCGSIFRVKPTGDDTGDGLSWLNAKKTVQAAINVAVSGDEVWVAAGTYAQCITMKPGVSIYGGFAGTETAQTERAWWVNVTILDGGKSASVVTCPSGLTYTTSVDGFTIRNGSAQTGGGIRLANSSPTIANNTITDNVATDQGGGIGSRTYDESSAVIRNNIITRNLAYSGGGIACVDQEYLYCNVIAANGAERGGGIYGYYHTGQIISNSIVGNGGLGIYNLWGGIKVANNIIAFNDGGIYTSETSGMVILQFNCVYNPGSENFKGITPGAGDFSADPKLVSPFYGEVHLLPGSPCIDAGYNTVSSQSWNDIDRGPRFVNRRVDIGADEYDGTAYTHTPVLIHVTPEGSDANDGLTWPTAKSSIQAGIDAATGVGGEVWVAGGHYYERIILKPLVHLYGNFAGTEVTREDRRWDSMASVIDGVQGGTVVTAKVPGFRTCTVDGFTIRNGKGTNGGGVNCSGSYALLTNNKIMRNEAKYGAGIYGSPYKGVISNSTIENNTATGPSPVDYDAAGIYLGNGKALVTCNTIYRNVAPYGDGGGIYSNGYHIISGNVIALNSAQRGGGFHLGSLGKGSLENNTFVGNIATDRGGAICATLSGLTVHNNIIAFNTSGVYSGNILLTDGFRRNNVYGNTDGDFTGDAPGPNPIDGISVDPGFVNLPAGDYHLTLKSPCINAGWNGAPNLPSSDQDGDARPLYGTADIGADEFSGAAEMLCDAKMTPNGVPVKLDGLVVTAVFDGFFYAELEDRSMGIRVEESGHDRQPGDVVSITGAIKTNADDERYLDATEITPTGQGTVEPVHINGGALGGGDFQYNPSTGAGQKGVEGGIGLNNIGLYITTWSKLSYLDGAASLQSSAGSDPVKLLYGGIGITWPTDYVRVTGVVSCSKDADGLHPAILVTDIAPLK